MPQSSDLTALPLLSELPKWNAHKDCVICSPDHPWGIALHLHRSGELECTGDWWVNPLFSGYNGLLQGGITAAILDDAMVNTLRLCNVNAKTAELSVRYVKEIPVNSTIQIKAQIVQSRKRLHSTTASIFLNNELVAHASAKFLS